jgi:DNA polymerase-3 subunit gamma/tau
VGRLASREGYYSDREVIMAESLAVKYRPKDWSDVCGQNSVMRILTRQLDLNELKNVYLFAGASGCGKTTLARIFANKINGGIGTPIEIDAASNNGVDNVKSIIKSAQERSIDSKYKIFIVDECHMITTQGWNAFLKCIEEPPVFTIFIFCTTDPQKIPATILNRVQRFNITRINTDRVRERLGYICAQEGFTNYEESVEYIAKLSDGGMRDAISTLEKCAGYSKDLSISNVLDALGNYSYDTFFSLINGIIDGKEDEVFKILDEFYRAGNDLKLFVDMFLSFCLDVSKYIVFQSTDMIKIPSSMEDKLKNSTNFENSLNYYMFIVNNLLDLKNMLKNDNSMRSTIEVMFLKMTRMQ